MERPEKFYSINENEYCYIQGTQKQKSIIFVKEIEQNVFLFGIPFEVMKKVIEENK